MPRQKPNPYCPSHHFIGHRFCAPGAVSSFKVGVTLSQPYKERGRWNSNIPVLAVPEPRLAYTASAIKLLGSSYKHHVSTFGAWHDGMAMATLYEPHRALVHQCPCVPRSEKSGECAE